jgi:hypothetical protein
VWGKHPAAESGDVRIGGLGMAKRDIPFTGPVVNFKLVDTGAKCFLALIINFLLALSR